MLGLYTQYLLSSWSPSRVISIEAIDYESERLICFESKGFCRYYLGLKVTLKPREWAHMSLETLRLVESIMPKTINQFSVEKCAGKQTYKTQKDAQDLLED